MLAQACAAAQDVQPLHDAVLQDPDPVDDGESDGVVPVGVEAGGLGGGGNGLGGGGGGGDGGGDAEAHKLAVEVVDVSTQFDGLG